tara:strand:+ start:93 stop:509 length:417 start_codon:yes stop_codon:yes gene_type:complete
MIQLQLEIGKTKDKSPSGKIIMNGEVIHNGIYTNDIIDLKPQIGHNVLKISLENKADKDTVLKGNQILEDVYVVVKDIRCQITQDTAGLLDDIGEYKTDKNESLKTYGYISYNGVYTFKFGWPFFVAQKNSHITNNST